MNKLFLSTLLFSACLGCQNPAPVANASSSPLPAMTPAASPSASVGLGAQQQADVQFSKTEYLPGEEIPLTIMAVGLDDSGWVGIVPSDIPHGDEKVNDDNDLSYIKPNSTPRLFLVAPEQTGSFDVRLNGSDDNGKELASRSFTVVEDPNPVKEPKISLESSEKIVAGEEVRVTFEAPLSYDSSAWVGWVPSKIPHGEEVVNDSNQLGYVGLQKRSRGTAVLTAPGTPGEYDLRLHDTDTEGKEVASLTVTVVEK